MLNQKQIIEYAIKGIATQIDELEKAINQGKRFLLEYENGEKPKTPKTPHEIKQIIQEKKDEIEKLSKEKNELYFMLDELQ